MTDEPSTETADEIPAQAEIVDETPEPAREVAVREPQAIGTPTTPLGEWNVIVAQAQTLSKSDIIPTAYRRKPENVVAAALTGRVYGWDVMAAMRNGHVIEGQYAIRPEAQLGLIRAAGHKVTGEIIGDINDLENLKAVVTGTRGDDGTTMTATYTFMQAVQAGLVSIRDGKPWARSQKNQPLPWEQTPEDMVWVRAVSRLARRHFSDVTLGLSYIADELTGGAFYEDEAGEAQVAEPERVLPTGWASWEECDNAHEAYIERWKSYPAEVGRPVTAFAREHGYQRPMAKAMLNALDAKLTQEVEKWEAAGGSTTRPASDGNDEGTAPAESAVPATEGDGDGGASVHSKGEQPATEAKAAPESSPVEVGPDGTPIDDAEIVPEVAPPAEGTGGAGDAGEAGEPAADGAGGAAEPPAPTAPPAPATDAEPSSPGEHVRYAQASKKIWPDTTKSQMARHALALWLTDGRTSTTKELSRDEIMLGIKGMKLFEAYQLGWAIIDPETQESRPLGDDEVPDVTAGDVPDLVSKGDQADAFFRDVLALQGVVL